MISVTSRLSRPNWGSRVLLALATLTALVSVERDAAARRYTLPELLARVDAVYPGVKAARAGVDVAYAQRSQANRLWFPTGTFNFALTGSPEIRCSGSGDQQEREEDCVSTTANTNLADTKDILKTLPFHGAAFALNVNLVQPLYTFGKIESARELAKAGINVATAQVDKDRAEAALHVIKAYWGLKWARASYGTLDDGVGKLKSWIKKIDEAIDKGKSTYTENDLARMKIASDSAELAELDVEKARDAALAGVRMLADDPTADIDEEELDEVEVTEQALSFYEDAARLHRPEARMLAAGLDAAHANWKVQRASLTPDLGLVLGFNYNYAQSVDDPQNGFMNHYNTLGATAALAVRYDLGVAQRLANMNKAHQDERVLQARREQALGALGLEIETAWLEARSARRKSDLLQHSEKVARGWYNAVDQNMTLGTAESRDLVDAARSYFELRLRHLQSIMDLNLALAGLQSAAGTLVQ